MDFNHNGKDDIQEIKDGWAAFVTDVRNGDVNAVVKDVTDAAAWIKGEIEGMEQAAQDFFNWGVDRVKAESKTLGEAVANMLTLLNNGSLQQGLGLAASAIAQLAALSSKLIESIMVLVGGFKAIAG